MIDGPLDRPPRTREAIEDGIRDRLHLGAQLYVSLHGEPVADAALGEDRPGAPLTRGHLMLWLSSTKPVPAVAIAQLWERGLLELDDPGGPSTVPLRCRRRPLGQPLGQDGAEEVVFRPEVAIEAAMSEACGLH